MNKKILFLLSIGILLSCQKYNNNQDVLLYPEEVIIEKEMALIQEEMVLIPAGTFYLGTDNYILTTAGTTDMLPDSSYHPHQVSIAEFKISSYEINSEVFFMFLKDVGRNIFDYDDTYSDLVECNGEEYFGYPAISSYYYAMDFCKWFSERNNKQYRLPTEAEWEYAATGGDDRIYPWGNIYETLGERNDELNSSRVIINKYSKDKSPFGVMNMYGNVAEWVMDYFQHDAYLKSPSLNPICIDAVQKSIDNYYSFPPTYVVRGINKYYYSLNMIEPNINSFATIKRRFPYWCRLFGYSQRVNIGFRIVEDVNDGELTTIHGPVTYHYEIYKTIKNADVFLRPDITSEALKMLEKDELFQSMFLFKDRDNSNWLRIQTFEYSDYVEGRKMGDDGVVGWIKLEYCDKIN